MTGKNPGKLGIFDFKKHLKRITSSKNIKSKTFYNLLGEHNKKSISVNVPGTFPPPKINGVSVAGLGNL